MIAVVVGLALCVAGPVIGWTGDSLATSLLGLGMAIAGLFLIWKGGQR